MTVILLRVLGGISFLLSCSQVLDDNQLERLERTIRENLVPRRLVRIPFDVFKTVVDATPWSEGALFGAVGMALSYLIAFDTIPGLKDNYIDLVVDLGAPLRAADNALGGWFPRAIAWVLFAACLFFVVPVLLLLISVTGFLVVCIYVILGLAHASQRLKQAYGLDGSLIKISSLIVSLLLYLVSFFA